MPDPTDLLNSLRRPRLLVRAAHIGLEDYNRDRGLKRLLPQVAPATSSDVFMELIEREAELNDARRTGGAAYSVCRHVELLVALIVEARLLSTRPV
jgi:hypothetical protein